MSPFSTPTLFWIALSALVITYSDARLVNFTIDDAEPDSVTGNSFSYAPDGRWNVGNECEGCSVRPDPLLASDGTWHDATFSNLPNQNEVQTARVDFNGSAIYVFGILYQDQPLYTVDMSFFIDGQLAGGFTYVPPGVDSYIYNFALYANDSIGDGMHSFELQNGRVGGATSLVLFDYIIYSQDIDDAIPPSSMTPTISSSIQTPTPAAPTSSSTFTPSPPASPSPTSSPLTSSAAPTSSPSASPPTPTPSSAPPPSSLTSSSIPTLFLSTSASTFLSTSIPTSTPSPSTSSSGLQTSSSSGSSAAPDVAPSPAAHTNNTRTVVIASVVPSILFLAAIGLWLMWRRRARYSHSDEKDTIGDIDAFYMGESSPEGEQQAEPADTLAPSPPERDYATGPVGAQSAIEGLSSGPSRRSGDSKAPPPYDSLSS